MWRSIDRDFVPNYEYHEYLEHDFRPSYPISGTASAAHDSRSSFIQHRNLDRASRPRNVSDSRWDNGQAVAESSGSHYQWQSDQPPHRPNRSSIFASASSSSRVPPNTIPEFAPGMQGNLFPPTQKYFNNEARELHDNFASVQPISEESDASFRLISEHEPTSYCCNASWRDALSGHQVNQYCHGCQIIFGDRCTCWNSQIAHARGGQRSGHEKISFTLAKWIHNTLSSCDSEAEQRDKHIVDSVSLWFGAGFDHEGTAVFRDFGRYASLLAERQHVKPCFPGLVSVVGETGAGKSSLIKLLISMHAVDNTVDGDLKTPVVGVSSSADTPTSGDVHLYCDPKTFNTSDPILYADCEGLHGGTRDPIGATYRKRRSTITDARRMQTASLRKHLRRKHDTSERELAWATAPHKNNRSYFVQTLYPRLLFTFSDVVMFVMHNARVIEAVVEQLIVWADAVLETSSNQPVLPHAIIVLNVSDNTDPRLWDVDRSTEALLSSIEEVVKTNAALVKCVKSWQYRGVKIKTAKALLLCYYSSIRVVRVPEKNQSSLMHQQIRFLYREIVEATQKSLESKSNSRMKLSSEEMQPYLHSAFDHFASTLDKPFDFVQASYTKGNIPSDFSGNILKLAINVLEHCSNLDAQLIFKELSFMLASCTMIDAIRKGILGLESSIVSHYLNHYDEALQDFSERYWPCEFISRGGSRCVNVKAGHSKGHQLHDGQIIESGSYMSTFTALSFRDTFLDWISNNLQQLLQKLNLSKIEMGNENGAAVKLHQDLIRHFYRHLGGASYFISHSACLSCLISPPEHCLPCGHILCSPCVQAFGQKLGRYAFEMTDCPLHEIARFSSPWVIQMQPSNAGIRILTLDGGGIRGIVELTSLRHIERELGGDLSIQSFFELIVGTSTGGIIALGLGQKGWTVEECIRKFEAMSASVFTEQKKVHFINALLATAARGGLYKTEPLEQILIEQFGEECLFGGVKEHERRTTTTNTKVAVTTTSIGGIPHVLANYNRQNGSQLEGGYEFLRAENPALEIKTWEAARSTSAAPRIFRAYDHVHTGKSFLDGGIYHNNPIDIAMREYRLIFPGSQDRLPDILVSVGTAFSAKKKQSQLSDNFPRKRGIISYYKDLLKISKDHLMHALDSEQKWTDFIHTRPSEQRSRFRRINFELKESCPKLDDVSLMRKLKSTVSNMLIDRKNEIRDIANRLIATSFYFEPSQKVSRNADGNFRISGFIECRFPPGSEEIAALGELFRKRDREAHKLRHSHPLCFLVEEDRRERDAQPIYVTDDVIVDMKERRLFAMDEVEFEIENILADVDIHLRFGLEEDNAANNSISGFPRCWEVGKTPLTRRPPSLSKKRLATLRSDKPAWSGPKTTLDGTVDAFINHDLPGLASEQDMIEAARKLTMPTRSFQDEKMVETNSVAELDGTNELPRSRILVSEFNRITRDAVELPAIPSGLLDVTRFELDGVTPTKMSDSAPTQVHEAKRAASEISFRPDSCFGDGSCSGASEQYQFTGRM